MSLFDLPEKRRLAFGCSECVCDSCLYWWSSRCPYGECYDDYRTKADPYTAAHPEEPPRTAWSHWNRPGEQEHWCRGGIFYPCHFCWHYVRYERDKHKVKQCLVSNVDEFQDGYILCGYPPGCEECYRRFEEKMKEDV